MKFLQQLKAMGAKKPAAQPPAQPDTKPVVVEPTQQTMENPLDLYAALQQNSGTEKKTAPAFNIPTETVQKAASQIDFVQSIPKDVMAKLQAGDLSVLGDAFNAVGRNAYSVAMEHGMAVTGQHLDNRMAFEQEGFDQRITSQLTTSNISSIENLHPAAQQKYKETIEQLRQQYPGASKEQLEGATWEVLEEFGSQFNRTAKQQEQQVAAKAVDYDQMAGYGGEGGEGGIQ